MPIRPQDFQTGGAFHGAVAASLLSQRDAAAELRVGDRVGVWRITRELGRGGMAIVYLAERADDEYQQLAALKWMQTAQVGETGELMFRRERQALADLRHPHIARLLDGGRNAEGRPWFAMEYIEGEPLDRHCVIAELPQALRLQLFLQVCTAVAFAHSRGVIHRDIKSSNVLVDSDGSARLLDFGIAQLLGEDESLAARAFTPGFASPEQLRGESLTVSADIFQLGRLLASLLSADSAEQATVLATHFEHPALQQPSVPTAAPPTLPVGVDRDMQAIITRACADEPARRYATVDALAADVRAAIDHRPVAARPRTALYVADRFLRRHPFGVAAGSVAILAIVLGTALFTYRLSLERDIAKHEARVAQTVLAFMRDDLLASADPAALPGEELSVRAALDLASASASTRFADLPVEHSVIRTTLASLYDALGRNQEALREAQHAVALAQSPQVSPVQRGNADETLAGILIANDRLDDAEAMLNRAALERAGDEGPNSRGSLRIRNSLGVLYNRRGEFEHAQSVHEEVLGLARTQYGPADELVRFASEQIALNLQMRGEHAAAMPLLEAALQTAESKLGEKHPATLQAAHNLGVLLRHEGRLDEALAALTPILAARREVLGPDHPETMSTSNEVATVLQELKRFDEAEPLFRAVLDGRLRKLGEEHLYTRNSMSNLGLLYSAWGKLDQAAPLYERALSVETRLIGETHPDTIALMHNIAGLYRKQGRLSDALAMHARVLKLAEASPDLGPTAWQTALFRAGRATTLQSAGQLADADAEFEKVIQILDATLGPDHPRSVRVREMRTALEVQRAAASTAG